MGLMARRHSPLYHVKLLRVYKGPLGHALKEGPKILVVKSLAALSAGPLGLFAAMATASWLTGPTFNDGYVKLAAIVSL